jgi:GH25 family lysozyme M1 (1,4-beta-N-acetylmuramidase)
MSKKGIDVSKWQQNIDWQKVKADGVEFAMLRAGYGKNNIDEFFVRNIKECNRLGIPCGAYWFSYAYTAEMAKQEAKYCLTAIKPYRVEYPVCYDFEYDSVNFAKKKGVKITKGLATTLVEAFCAEVEKARYYAMYYTNQDYATNMLDVKALEQLDLWYAWYNATCNRSNAGLWQYSSSGKISGINGNVDMNYANRDYPAIMRKQGLNGLKPSIRVGSRVRIMGSKYTNGVKIPESVRKGIYTVQQIKSDRALLKEIYSWVALKDLKQV